MKKFLRPFILIVTLLFILCTLSCEHNVYIPDNNLWEVNGKYFATLQEAMNYIYSTTKSSKALEDVPAERTAILQRDVKDGERGGGLLVPEDFSGMLTIDFNTFTYEFDDSLKYFFDVRGGDEVYITNGTTVIYNEADHEPYAIAVNSDTVTIDSHLIDDRRVDSEDSTVSEARLIQVGEKGSVVIENVQETESAALTGQISVVTDGTSGGKLSINNARIVVTNIITAYKASDGTVSDTIPEETEIEEEAKSTITINSGYVSIKNIEKLSDYYVENSDSSVTLFKKAVLNIFSNDSENKTEIDNPHDTEDEKIDSAIDSIIVNAGESGENVEHEHIHAPVVEHPGQAATCTEDGFLTYWECTTCGKKFSSAKCKSENRIDEPIVVPATGHNLYHFEKVPATCTEDGNIEYWYCDRCGKYFSDSAAETEIDKSDTVISATGHSFDEVWHTDSNGHWHECTHECGTTDSYAKHTNQTYNDKNSHWVLCSVCGYSIMEKTGHSWVTIGGETFCSYCGYVKEEEPSGAQSGFDVTVEDLIPAGYLTASDLDTETNTYTVTFTSTNEDSVPTEFSWYLDEKLVEGETGTSIKVEYRYESFNLMVVFSNEKGTGSASITLD